jgi:hypothetical protein
MKEEIKTKKKHRHRIEVVDSCDHCGAEDGYCKGCDKTFYREHWSEKWQEE